MKITKIEIFDCELKTIVFNPVFVRVHTDEGIHGVGEAGLAYGNSSKAAVGQLRDFAKLILGKNPLQIESIWETLYRSTYWGTGGGAVVYSGISAIDIALWDILGKSLNTPVYQLLGGKTNDNLRCYASQLHNDWDVEDYTLVEPVEYAKAVRKALDDGYDCVKVDPIQVDRAGRRHLQQAYFGLLTSDQIQMAYDRLEAMRNEMGPKPGLILEVHALLGTNSAIQLGNAVKDLDIFYYEEPINPMNTKAFSKIAEKVNIPLATGERSYTRWGYRDLMERQTVAVVQPDLCNCGGITEGKKISDYANIYDATVQVHVCGGPVSTAAALQVEAVIPNFIIHEHHTYSLKPELRNLCTYDYQPVGGKYKVPDLPGIGQTLNDEAVGEYLVTTLELPA